jgi:hypothetical protein
LAASQAPDVVSWKAASRGAEGCASTTASKFGWRKNGIEMRASV